MTCTLLDPILSTGTWGHQSCWSLKAQGWEEGTRPGSSLNAAGLGRVWSLVERATGSCGRLCAEVGDGEPFGFEVGAGCSELWHSPNVPAWASWRIPRACFWAGESLSDLPGFGRRIGRCLGQSGLAGISASPCHDCASCPRHCCGCCRRCVLIPALFSLLGSGGVLGCSVKPFLAQAPGQGPRGCCQVGSTFSVTSLSPGWELCHSEACGFC